MTVVTSLIDLKLYFILPLLVALVVSPNGDTGTVTGLLGVDRSIFILRGF